MISDNRWLLHHLVSLVPVNYLIKKKSSCKISLLDLLSKTIHTYKRVTHNGIDELDHIHFSGRIYTSSELGDVLLYTNLNNQFYPIEPRRIFSIP